MLKWVKEERLRLDARWQNFPLVGLLLLAIVPLMITGGPALTHLFSLWLNEAEYSHGLVVGAIGLYLFLVNLRRHYVADRHPWLGVALLLLAYGCILLSVKTEIYSLGYYGFLLGVIASVAALLGRKNVRLVLFPALLILFAMPLPYIIGNSLTAQMQLVSSDLGVVFLRAFGYPVFQNGNVIDFGEFELQVAEACSGLRYLFPLFSISLIMASFFQGNKWQRAVIALSAIPITIALNSLRIAVAGILVTYFGTGAAEGFIHDFEGWVVFVVALLLLFAVVVSLARWSDRGTGVVASLEWPSLDQGVWPKGIEQPGIKFGVVAMSLCFALISFALQSRISPLSSTDTDYIGPQLPKVIGPRLFDSVPIRAEFERILQADELVNGDYIAANQVPVNFFLAYYQEQKHGKVLHSPKACLPGGGWLIQRQQVVYQEALNGNVNRVITAKDGQELLIYYWVYQGRQVFANELWARLSLILDAFISGSTRGAIVRVTVPIVAGDTAAADSEALAFIEAMAPQLNRIFTE